MAVLLESERHLLILEGIKELDFVLASFLPGLPIFIDKSDLIGEAFIAIIRATDKFDPSLDGGAQFKTYINPKIRGAIINHLTRFEKSKRAFREVDIVHYASNGGAEELSDHGEPAKQLDVKVRLAELFECLTKEERVLVELSFIR